LASGDPARLSGRLSHLCPQHSQPIFNPVLVSVTFIISLLLLTGTPYRTYFDGAQLLHSMLGPATMALAIPLYAQIGRMRAMLLPMTLALLARCMTAILSGVAIGWVFGASRETLPSLAPKSTPMPIAMAATGEIGGLLVVDRLLGSPARSVMRFQCR